MRTMLKISLPVERSNQAIKDGTLPKTLNSVMDQIKPEASYFYAENGLRTAVLIFDMKDPSQIPVIAEPFFMNLDAAVDFRPVMNAQDLKAGLEKAAKSF